MAISSIVTVKLDDLLRQICPEMFRFGAGSCVVVVWLVLFPIISFYHGRPLGDEGMGNPGSQ